LGALRKAQLEARLTKPDKVIEQLLDRIVEANSATVIQAFQKRIGASQKEKLLLEEKIRKSG